MLEVCRFCYPACETIANSVVVGFTGSGQQMRKDPGRSRHIYQQGADDEGL